MYKFKNDKTDLRVCIKSDLDGKYINLLDGKIVGINLIPQVYSKLSTRALETNIGKEINPDNPLYIYLRGYLPTKETRWMLTISELEKYGSDIGDESSIRPKVKETAVKSFKDYETGKAFMKRIHAAIYAILENGESMCSTIIRDVVDCDENVKEMFSTDATTSEKPLPPSSYLTEDSVRADCSSKEDTDAVNLLFNNFRVDITQEDGNK